MKTKCGTDGQNLAVNLINIGDCFTKASLSIMVSYQMKDVKMLDEKKILILHQCIYFKKTYKMEFNLDDIGYLVANIMMISSHFAQGAPHSLPLKNRR